jgi:predicted DNA-binding transcriptional regulator YafY
MRRAERLFHLVNLLSQRTVMTARQLAKALVVSDRTVYRDVRDLVRTGVPIKGEAGVGYLLLPGDSSTPIVLTPIEIEALMLGSRIVTTWADPELARAAESVALKIAAGHDGADTPMFSPRIGHPAGDVDRLAEFRTAIKARHKLRFTYRHDDRCATRTVRPLGLFFWGVKWTVVGWCELRNDFRSFRIDRVSDLCVLDEQFESETGRTLADFWQYVAVHSLEPDGARPRAIRAGQVS